MVGEAGQWTGRYTASAPAEFCVNRASRLGRRAERERGREREEDGRRSPCLSLAKYLSPTSPTSPTSPISPGLVLLPTCLHLLGLLLPAHPPHLPCSCPALAWPDCGLAPASIWPFGAAPHTRPLIGCSARCLPTLRCTPSHMHAQHPRGQRPPMPCPRSRAATYVG